jgi:hypothetical protein
MDQDRAVVYAGAVTTIAQWNAFNEAWESILNRYDLAYFKMAEAATFYGEFAPKVSEWGNEKEAKRDGLLAELEAIS